MALPTISWDDEYEDYISKKVYRGKFIKLYHTGIKLNTILKRRHGQERINKKLMKEKVLSCLPLPHLNSDETMKRYICGESPEIVVDFLKNGVSISIYTAQWNGSHSMKITAKKHLSLDWKFILNDIEFFKKEIQEARGVRLSTFRKCCSCQNMIPPEHTTDYHGETICHGCVTSDYGMVF